MPQRHETLPEIPHDTAFLCSPADVPGPCKVQLQDKNITTDIRQKFEELCEEYGEAFSKKNEDIGRTKLVKMDIDTGDSPPVSSRPYTLPLKHYEWVQREIESLECAGVITKSMSKWASPIVIVPKKSAPGEPPKRRLCVDLRKVNELQQEVITAGKTKGQISIHPLPKIDEMYCYIVGLGLNCKFIDLLFKRSFIIFIKISLYLNFIVLEIISKQTDTLTQELMYLR